MTKIEVIETLKNQKIQFDKQKYNMDLLIKNFEKLSNEEYILKFKLIKKNLNNLYSNIFAINTNFENLFTEIMKD